MNRTVLILSTGRSGTSALGGVLHKLGVHMGDQFMKADENNRYGTYEEIEFFNKHRMYVHNRPNDFEEWLPGYIARRSEGHQFWGIKEPLIVRTLPMIVAQLEDPIVVVIERYKDACIGSFEYAYSSTYEDAVKWYDAVSEDLHKSLDAVECEIVRLSFDDLIENPECMVRSLASVIFTGMDTTPTDEQFEEAIEHIRPIAPRWDRNGKWVKRADQDVEGWGNLAIGTRIAKHPEFHFFTSWTALLTGGLRAGDTVLLPRGWVPAHWAANSLIRDFIKTNKHSLMMIDDDMEFKMNDVERMRANKANWEYDIAFAFCTNRSWPPSPVVYKLWDEQPGPPRSLHGDFFDRLLIRGNEVVPVDAAGFAMTLIKRNVVEAMTGEYGPMHTFYAQYDKGKESEDVYFSRQARELGFKICVDQTVTPNHIGVHSYGREEYMTYLNTMIEKSKPSVDIDATKMVGILEESMPYLSDSRADAEALLASVVGDEDA